MEDKKWERNAESIGNTNVYKIWSGNIIVGDNLSV